MKKGTTFVIGIAVGVIFALFAATAGWISFNDIVRSWGWEDTGEMVRTVSGMSLFVLFFGGLIALFGYGYENYIRKIFYRILKKIKLDDGLGFSEAVFIFILMTLIGWIITSFLD